MPKVSETYTDKYIKAADLGDGPQQFEIAAVDVELLSGRDNSKAPKIIVCFAGMKKGWVCNRTNAKKLTELLGDDTDGWIGAKVTIMSCMVQFGSNMVAGITVRGAVKPRQKPEK